MDLKNTPLSPVQEGSSSPETICRISQYDDIDAEPMIWFGPIVMIAALTFLIAVAGVIFGWAAYSKGYFSF